MGQSDGANPGDSLADVLHPLRIVRNSASLAIFIVLGVAALLHGLLCAAALVRALACPPEGPPGEAFFWALHVISDVAWVMVSQLVAHGAATRTRRAWATALTGVSAGAACAIGAFWALHVSYACTWMCMMWNTVYVCLSVAVLAALHVPRLSVLLPYREEQSPI